MFSVRLPSTFVVLMLALAGTAHGATYYVDQTVGNDSNPGTQAAPWRNCPGMATYSGSRTLAAGDAVYFDRADTWVVSSGRQGLWLTGGVRYVGNEWGSGSGRAIIRAGADFIDNGVIRFSDHATIETVFKGFEVDVAGRVATGIDINHGFWTLMNGATKRAEDNIVHGIFSNQNLGQYKYGIIVSNHGGTGGYAENVEIVNNVVYDSSRVGIALYPGDENANTRIRNILVRGNTIYRIGTDPNYCCGEGIAVKGWVVDAVIEHNYIHDTDGASIFFNSNETNHFGTGPTNIHVRYNIITNSTIHGAVRLYDGTGGSDPKDVKVYGNLIYNSTTNGGLLMDSLVGTVQLRVYNNTFVNAPVLVLNPAATFPVFEFRNNIVYYTGGTPLTDSAGKITLHTNNLYYRGGGTIVSSRGTNYSATNLSSYEPTALSIDPLFASVTSLPTGFAGQYGVDLAPNTIGLSLQSASMAIDRGAALTSEFADSVNSVARPAAEGWDIGAYESGGTGLALPHAPTNLRIVSSQ